MQDRVRIACSTTEHVSLAYHQNAIPIVREITVENATEADIVDIRLSLASHPAILRPGTILIERVAAGHTRHVELPDIHLDVALLAGFTEASSLDLTVKLDAAGGVAQEHVVALRLLPPSHWGGVRSAPELLAAFVRPNDPAIDVVLRDAASKLAAAGRETALDGYATGRKSRVWEIAEALWAALSDRRIAYVLPPASFERTGQKVRGPSDVLERQVGTCLDLSLVYAAALEQAGLNPLVVLTTGHAFVGLWLTKDDVPSAVIDDLQLLRKRRDLEDLILVETTLLTGEPPAHFTAATERGARHVDETATAALEAAIDIRRCRDRGIHPLELGGSGNLGIAPVATAPLDQGLTPPPSFQDDARPGDDVEDAGLDRLERWKRRLLDLTLRNKLLNFKPAKTSIAIDCAEASAVEDRLASGRTFRLLPRSDVLLDGSDQRSRELFLRQNLDDGRRRYLADALDRDELHTLLGPDELDDRLLDLFRLARNGFEEGGANILFLAIGFLTWTRKEGETPCRAPLLLIPASLRRSSVRAGFRLALHDDEPRFNPTLIELLRQDFKLRMPELEGDLPRDGSGLDVDRILRVVRQHVRDRPGWEVTPEVVLSAFSFTKYLMWRDLVDRADMLRRSPVLRHLLDTPTHSYGDETPFPEPGRLDAEHRPEDVFAPLSADSSQLSAVLAAAAGKDFVLFGPPGTGKSQTIGNMIAQCLAGGRTVLFVSQKTAALEVVQRRLQEIGLGEYCLEVHSTKAQKSAVLGQLRTAWHDRVAPSAAGWSEATSDLAGLRDELNGLVTALHRRRENGMSAYEAFGRVVAAATTDERPIALSWPDGVAHDAEELARLRGLCRELRPVLSSVGDIMGHPLAGLGASEWSPRWRAALETTLARYIEAVSTLGDRATSFARLMGVESLADTYAGTRGLVVLGSFLIKPEARAGAVLLGPEAELLKAALAGRDAFEERSRRLAAQLTGRYRPSIHDDDVPGMLAAWIDAQGANFLLRGGKTKKVRLRVGVHSEGEPPDDLGPDLAALVTIGKHLAAGCPEDSVLAAFGPPWTRPPRRSGRRRRGRARSRTSRACSSNSLRRASTCAPTRSPSPGTRRGRSGRAAGRGTLTPP